MSASRAEKKKRDPLVAFFVHEHNPRSEMTEPIPVPEEREVEVNIVPGSTAVPASRGSGIRQSVDSGYEEEDMTGRKLGCRFCCKRFSLEATLRRHVKLQHQRGVGRRRQGLFEAFQFCLFFGETYRS